MPPRERRPRHEHLEVTPGEVLVRHVVAVVHHLPVHVRKVVVPLRAPEQLLRVVAARHPPAQRVHHRLAYHALAVLPLADHERDVLYRVFPPVRKHAPAELPESRPHPRIRHGPRQHVLPQTRPRLRVERVVHHHVRHVLRPEPQQTPLPHVVHPVREAHPPPVRHEPAPRLPDKRVHAVVARSLRRARLVNYPHVETLHHTDHQLQQRLLRHQLVPPAVVPVKLPVLVGEHQPPGTVALHAAQHTPEDLAQPGLRPLVHALVVRAQTDERARLLLDPDEAVLYESPIHDKILSITSGARGLEPPGDLKSRRAGAAAADRVMKNYARYPHSGGRTKFLHGDILPPHPRPLPGRGAPPAPPLAPGHPF